MATHALSPAPLPANTDRAAFNLAMTRCTAASGACDALSASATIADEIAAGEALEHALAVLQWTATPDHATFARKLRATLAAHRIPADLTAALVADVNRLAQAVEGRA